MRQSSARAALEPRATVCGERAKERFPLRNHLRGPFQGFDPDHFSCTFERNAVVGQVREEFIAARHLAPKPLWRGRGPIDALQVVLHEAVIVKRVLWPYKNWATLRK